MKPATRILVIEDELNIRQNIAELLTLHNFDVQTAANGREGISQAMLGLPDLILCDIMMPEVDGFKVLKTIRNTRALANVPFIFLTAMASLDDLRLGMNAGADDYLTKPFTLNSLLQAITSRLQRDALRKAELQARVNEYRQPIERIAIHEYNTPLSAIIGFSELMVNHHLDFDTEENVSILNMIKVCALRLKRVLDNSRLIDTLQSLLPNSNLYTFYTTGQTWLTAEVMNKQLQTVLYRQDLKIESQINMIAAQVSLSEENLLLIIDELLDNAIKFTEEAQPIQIQGTIDGTSYCLAITNHGREFKAEDIARVGPYMQFDRAMYEQQGLGLGLAITNKTLELNNGKSLITSIDGTTTVSIWLPLANLTS